MNVALDRETAAQVKKHAYRFDEVGPESLAGQHMRRFWHPIALSADLPPGRAKPVRILGESFTVYRGETGTVHLTEFRCPHRGVQLSIGWIEEDALRCFYHGWKFDAQGQCTEQPGEKDGGFAHRVKLATYPVQEYLGFIFAYFGPGEPPPLPRYPVLERGGRVDASFYVRHCNYFQNIENGVDEVHVNFTHSQRTSFTDAGLNDEVPLMKAEPTSYGLVEYALRSGDRVRETHFAMPNILFLKLPPQFPGEEDWRDYVSWRVPIDNHVHMSFIAQRLTLSPEGLANFEKANAEVAQRLKALPALAEVGQKILAGELTLADVQDRDDLVGIQDYISQVGQGVIADRVHERLGKSDVAIVLMRNLWERELRKLEKGEALTQWVAPSDLASTIGL